jgi:nitronate monooxygenase
MTRRRVPWHDTSLTRLLGIRLPIVLSPMAGPSTPELAAAVSEAGGLGSLAGAPLSPDDLRAAIRQTRSLTEKPFAVSVFAPVPAPSTEGLAEWAALTGRDPSVPPASKWTVDDQIEVVVSEGAAALSFTFGIPDVGVFAGVTIGTATTVEEALALERAGIDVVVAQGFEAGGHRGSFLAPPDESLVGTLSLVPQVVDAVSVPVVAAGGIGDGRGIAAALALGAEGAQLGTVFIATDESAASEEHRAALGAETTISRVWTGRHARGVRSAEVDALERSGLEPPDFPLGRFLFPGPVLLAGQSGRLARPMPAGDLVRVLAEETSAALAAFG